MAASESTQAIVAALGATMFFTDSTAAVAAGASVNGPTRAHGGTAGAAGGIPYNQFVGEAFADVAGTLYVDKSTDGGATCCQVGSVAVTAGTSSQLSTRITAAAYRTRFTAGGAATGVFLLTSAYTLA